MTYGVAARWKAAATVVTMEPTRLGGAEVAAAGMDGQRPPGEVSRVEPTAASGGRSFGGHVLLVDVAMRRSGDVCGLVVTAAIRKPWEPLGRAPVAVL